MLPWSPEVLYTALFLIYKNHKSSISNLDKMFVYMGKRLSKRGTLKKNRQINKKLTLDNLVDFGYPV